jgi:hypothetical protein
MPLIGSMTGSHRASTGTVFATAVKTPGSVTRRNLLSSISGPMARSIVRLSDPQIPVVNSLRARTTLVVSGPGSAASGRNR